MAASTENVGAASDSSETSDSLDPRSSSFNPRELLYARTVTLPNPDAKQFNNLSEFENFIQGKDAASHSKQQKQKKPARNMHSKKLDRAAAKAYEAERKAAIMGKSNAGPSVRSAAQLRRLNQKNVLTKMDGCIRGPLSLLNRCVNERLKVIVVVRAAVAVRSHCRAYVVAFDKHMNMALMDVDETYIRPVVKPKAAGAKCVDRGDSADESVATRTERLSLSSDNETSNIKKERSKPTPSKRQDKLAAENPTDDKVADLRTKLLKSKSQKGAHSDSETSATRSRAITSSSSRNKTHSSMSDSECIKETKGKHLKTETSSRKTGDKFWPLYKEWAERRCYTQYEVLERHVNQLFIRGDNVVSVAIAP